MERANGILIALTVLTSIATVALSFFNNTGF